MLLAEMRREVGDLLPADVALIHVLGRLRGPAHRRIQRGFTRGAAVRDLSVAVQALQQQQQTRENEIRHLKPHQTLF